MRINPLPFIALWLDTFSYEFYRYSPRADLEKWFDGLDTRDDQKQHKSLIVDCLIAVGIGLPEDQDRTVICDAHHPY